MELAVRAPADGYTLLANTTPLVANSSLYPSMGFKPERDFAPVSLVASAPSVLVVTPSLAAQNVKELIALARAKPGVLKYTSSGPGTITHLAAELFKFLTQTDILNVTYKGGGPGLTAVVSGECNMSFQVPVAVSGLVGAGRLRALAVTGRNRLPSLPNVPTIAESGVPKFEFNSWVGIVAPAGTPQPVIKLLNEHVVKAAHAPEVAERLAREDTEVVASTPEALRATMNSESALWANVIKEMGIRAE